MTRFPPTPRSFARGLLASAVACLLPSCAGLDGDIDAYPIVRSEYHPLPGFTETDVAGPFGTYVSKDRTRKYGVRPLFMTYKQPWRDTTEMETITSFIAPFGKYTSNPRTTQFRFWPLVWYTNERTGEGGSDKDFLLFPFIYTGSTTPPANALASGETDDSYFALFPLIGQINSFIGYDRFQFLAWPILQRLTKRVFDEEENFHSIALLLGWTTGYPRGGSWHLLPLYIKSKWTYPPFRAPKYPEGTDPSKPLPRYVKETYLWPFIHNQTTDMDKGEGKETTLFSFWPFYKHEKAYDHEFWTVLWPLFRWNKEYPLARDSAHEKDGDAEDDRGKDLEADKNSNVLVDFLSQLVWRYQRTDKFERRRLLFILYSDYKSLPDLDDPKPGLFTPVDDERRDSVKSMAILQPIGFWQREFQELGPLGGYRDNNYYVLVPFFTTQKRTYLNPEGRKDGRVDHFTKLWPIFSYEWNADGSRDVHIIPLLPLRVEKYTRDFLDSWSIFLNLYRYERAPESLGGYTRHTAFMNMFKSYSDDRESTLSIPLLYSSRTLEGDDGGTSFSRRVLMGLFGYEGKDNPDGSESRTLRLFFLPLSLD